MINHGSLPRLSDNERLHSITPVARLRYLFPKWCLHLRVPEAADYITLHSLSRRSDWGNLQNRLFLVETASFWDKIFDGFLVNLLGAPNTMNQA